MVAQGRGLGWAAGRQGMVAQGRGLGWATERQGMVAEGQGLGWVTERQGMVAEGQGLGWAAGRLGTVAPGRGLEAAMQGWAWERWPLELGGRQEVARREKAPERRVLGAKSLAGGLAPL